MNKFTAEQVAKMAKQSKGTYLTVEQFAAYMNRSVSWVNQQVRAGNIAPDALLVTGKRGRPGNLFKKGAHALRAKQTAKTAYKPRKAKTASRKAA